MAIKWQKTQYRGVRFHESSDGRKHNGHMDRYFSIRHMVNGKMIEEGVGWTSEGWNASRVNNLRSELIDNARHGRRPMTLAEKRSMDKEQRQAEQEEQRQAEAENISFNSLAERYLEWSRSTKSSHQHDTTRYHLHIKPILGDLPAKDISPLLVEKIRIGMQKTHSPRTVDHVLSLVRSIFFKAEHWGLFKNENPAKKVTFPKYDNGRERYLDHGEAKLLLDTLIGKDKDVHDKTVLGIFCGLRYGEIAKLTWADVDMTNHMITVLDSKTAKNRVVPFPGNVADMFESRLHGMDYSKAEGLVFPNRKGTVLKQIEDVFQEVADKLFNQNVKDRRQRIVFHSCRHTFCSWLSINGVELHKIMKLSGHRTYSMVLRYAHLQPNHTQEAVGKLFDSFKSATTESRAAEVILMKARR